MAYPRDLSILAGDQQTPNTQGTDQSAYSKFNLALMQMLKQYQGLGTQQFVQAQQQGVQEQSNRIMATPPQGLVGANPALQNQVRQAQAGAMNPTIEGAGKMGKTFSEQISGLGDVISQARGIGEWMYNQEQSTRKEARDLVLNNTDAVKAMEDKSRSVLLKQAGIDEDFLQSIPKKVSEVKAAQTVETDEGIMQWNPSTSRYDIRVGARPLTATEKKAQESGKTSTFDEQQVINDIDSLLKDNKGLKGATGVSWLGRTGLLGRAEKQNFIGSVEQILSQLSLDALIQAKAAGATFGALSDAELRMLSSSATKIGAWRVKDKNGATTGYNVGEDAMKKELENIKKLMQKAKTSTVSNTGGQTSSGLKYTIE